MRTFVIALLGNALLLAAGNVCAGCGPSPSLLAQEAIAGDAEEAAAAVAELRMLGYSGLDALLRLDEQIRSKANQTGEPQDPTTARRLIEAIDAVAGQRDARSSRLFWHTDLAEAVAEAQATGRPILSLRMLGNLTEEYSCANSRFFRTVLYANTEVAAALRERFVLHWKSVRPVPRVTIDFGDGRKLERTLTGNSIHYVLDSRGRVVDALPGLYGPQAFLRGLGRAEQVALLTAAIEGTDRTTLVQQFHTVRAVEIAMDWQRDLAALGLPTALAAAPATANPPAADGAAPGAAEAGELSVSKSDIELPLLAAFGYGDLASAGVALDAATSDETWQQIAALHAADAELDAGSVELMRAKNPNAAQAGALARGKRRVEDPLLRMVAEFQQSIALDTVQNEYRLHRRIHEWLAAGEAPEIETLNEQVYAELFLTPSSDPWLGLVPADTYTALENGGVVATDVP
jgi:hypothetical protein